MLTKKILVGLSVFLLSFALTSTSFASESGEGGFNSLLDQMGNPIQTESQLDATHATSNNTTDEAQEAKPRVQCAKASNYNLLASVSKTNCWDLTGS